MKQSALVSRLTFAAVCAVLASGAHASPTVVTLDAPGGFISTCGGLSGTTGAVGAGGDLEAFYLVDSNCQSQQFTTGTASASAAFSGGGANNAAQGTVGFGFMQLSANNSSTNNASFPYGTAQAGWEDTLVFSAPGLSGQPGIATGSLAVNGQWTVSGFAGAAGVYLQPYRNSAQFTYPGGGGDIQGHSWNSSFFPNGVNETVQLTIPFIYGEAFDFAVFAVLRAGLRSVSGVEGISSSTADFTNTITWQGIDGVFAAGVPVPDYALSAASGTDWRLAVAVIPEPPVWLALAAGLLLVSVRLQRRRHA